MSSDRDQLFAVNIPLRNLEVRDRLERLVEVNSVSLRNLGSIWRRLPPHSFISQFTTKEQIGYQLKSAAPILLCGLQLGFQLFILND